MCIFVCALTEIVHEDVKIGSDGESDQASATSSDEVHSPVRVRMRNNAGRKISTEVLQHHPKPPPPPPPFSAGLVYFSQNDGCGVDGQIKRRYCFPRSRTRTAAQQDLQ